MKTDFLTQPDVSFGRVIEDEISKRGVPRVLVVVSAFASLTTAFRFKPLYAAVKAAAGDARLVLGVDLGGTSKEVLKEVAGWEIPVFIVKNRIVGITFHPKIYMLSWVDHATVMVGSSNFTEGGLFRNSEAASKTDFARPVEESEFSKAKIQLKRFIDPSGPTTALLTPEYLQALVALPEIPSEAQARIKRGDRLAKKPKDSLPTNIFGVEIVPHPPKLPIDLQKLLLAARKGQIEDWKREAKTSPATGKGVKKSAKPSPPAPLAEIDPVAFYMTLPAMKANNPRIPGECRIPLEARDMAPDFWGWRDNYEQSISPRAGAKAKEPRIYWNWYPTWRTTSTNPGTESFLSKVRMYLYENSSDFRFHDGDLNRLGAKKGDIVRLMRVDEEDAVYECTLAPTGTPQYAAWLPLLQLQVKNGESDRIFGYS